mmetsp:Transcript_33234/g.64895  ORF Transcript_33234/g.64895 Transcript_33234/m.64895 type:complete len:343 (+) Transcript_33234:3-1031(+)|eukprot:CAMPEP_0173397158 /NCGR_PEP_ID=MMETSP1356-20130122/37559_1 /TAXON_ID=77927 ORGANISM="Hemiselmis virescens, Strain PCC157" /NCGR_SAMPLE_ID=MMETSP1356 /ASSEMBLY_ACC=CAM_ASM_000847 /LENGTH=342 /DNA_ID=CAMNT_0014356353 /DNA_START=1 /DNA_END=1032 /DNA_ORIENTATION=+
MAEAGGSNLVAMVVKWVFFSLMAWWYIRNVAELSLALIIYSAAWHSKIPPANRSHVTMVAVLLMGHSIVGNSILKAVGLLVVVWLGRQPLSYVFDFGGPLHVLAMLGQTKAMGALIKLGFSVEAQTFIGKRTALHQAALAGRDEACVALVRDHGANIKAKDMFNRVPLHLAASASRSACIKSLVELKCPIDIRANSGATPLHMAAESERPTKEGLTSILEARADINAQDEAGGSALQRLAYRGNEGAVRLLLESNAKPDVAAKSGATPLILAAMEGFSGVVTLLVANGANKKAKVMQGKFAGKTALELAKDVKTRIALGEKQSQEAQLGDAILEQSMSFATK